MKITPLVLHGGLILPRHTPLFSDALPVASIEVEPGGLTTLICSSPHGLATGATMAVSITDAETPNGVTAVSIDADGNLVLTTSVPHNITTTPDPARYKAWNETATLGGFGDDDIDGIRQLVAAPDANTIVVVPGAEIASVTLTGSEAVLERLDYDVVGWHAVTASSSTTLTFPTPAAVTRSYTVEAPVVVRDIRIMGALDFDTALALYAPDDVDMKLLRPTMFVLPRPANIRRSGAMDMGPGSDYRRTLDDGFIVLVFIPAQSTVGHVRAIDLAQHDILSAVLRTFNGLRLRRSEFFDAGPHYAQIDSHQGAHALKSRALYAHEYVFDAPAILTNADAIAPHDWADIDDAVIQAGTPPTSITSGGVPAWRGLDITGILHHGHPSPLIGSYDMETA